jgi:hypothetical protein
MDSLAKKYLAATVIVIAAVMVIQLYISTDTADLLISSVAMLCGYPCLAFGLYMYLEGRGSRYISGVDFSGLSEREVRNVTSYLGLYTTIGSALLIIGLGIILSYLWVAIILMVVCSAMIIGAVALYEKGLDRPFVERSGATKAAVFLAVSLVAIAPMMILNATDYSSDSVTVEFMEDEFRIKAPMFDRTFEYDEVEMLGYDPNFDKGSRIMGYGTPTISSGTYKNAQFGSYQLASYTQIMPCVFFQYDERYFAFNLSSDDLTEGAYERLSGLVKT